MSRSIKIGTRGSKLALWQANFAKQALADIGIESELHIIKTKGDKIQNLSFDKIEGKGFFTKEIESALLSKEVDLAREERLCYLTFARRSALRILEGMYPLD